MTTVWAELREYSCQIAHHAGARAPSHRRRALDDEAGGRRHGVLGISGESGARASLRADRAGALRAGRADVPGRFEAVGEALIAGRTATDACEVVGRLLGSQGVSLEETLADLRTTYELVLGTEPAFTDACAVALGWSEATLAYLHQLSCADPLTGLASMAHLRGRLTELYRGDTRGPAPSASATRSSSWRQRPRVSPGSPTRSSASTCGCPGSGSPHARSSPATRPSAGSAHAGS